MPTCTANPSSCGGCSARACSSSRQSRLPALHLKKFDSLIKRPHGILSSRVHGLRQDTTLYGPRQDQLSGRKSSPSRIRGVSAQRGQPDRGEAKIATFAAGCATSCGRIPTSSWWERSEIWRRRRSPSRPRSRPPRVSPRCTPTTPGAITAAARYGREPYLGPPCSRACSRSASCAASAPRADAPVPSAADLKPSASTPRADTALFRGKGCDACRGTATAAHGHLRALPHHGGRAQPILRRAPLRDIAATPSTTHGHAAHDGWRRVQGTTTSRKSSA